MLHNDLSNALSVVIGVRCDNFLIEYKEGSFLDPLKNIIAGGKERRAEINEKVLSLLNYIFRETEYTVDLVVLDKYYTPKLKEILDSLPFNRVVIIKGLSDVTYRLNIGDLTYYVDRDAIKREVNSKFAFSLTEIYSMIRRGV